MGRSTNLNPMIRIGGRSFLFNSLLIAINLLGLILVVMGYHQNFEENKMVFVASGTTLMALSIVGLIILKGRMLMNGFSRVLVGGLFIVSGLVKANDPIGFAYKLEEYFEDGALAYRIKEWFGIPEFTLEALIQFALPLSILICIVEIVLGVLTLLGRKMKMVSTFLILLMVFFTFLTWHTANCDSSYKFRDRDRFSANDEITKEKIQISKTNKDIQIISKSKSEIIIDEFKQPQCVDDCGCFGDALKGSVGRSLTPKESLWKDIVLLYFGIWILVASFKQGKIEASGKRSFILGGLLVVLFFCWVFSWYFPLAFYLLALLGALWCLGIFMKKWVQDLSIFLWTIILCGLMLAYVLSFDPIKDYRPYAVGSNLKYKMKDGQEGKYENLLVYKNIKTKEKKEYDGSSKEYINSKIWEDKNWKYLTMTQKEIIPMRIPSITDQFNPTLYAENITEVENELEYVSIFMKPAMVEGLRIFDKKYKSTMEIPMGEYSLDGFPTDAYTILDTISVPGEAPTEISLRDFIVNENQIFVMVAKKIEDANWTNLPKYKAILALCKQKKIPMILLVSSSPDQITRFRKKYNFKIPIFINDETELKAITRSNPALLVIEKGKVVAKYPHRSTPKSEWINENIIHK